MKFFHPISYYVLSAAVLAACLTLPLRAQAGPPAEAKEVQAALTMKDSPEKLKELERILSIYPATQLKAILEAQVQSLKVSLAATLDEVLEIQRRTIEAGKGSQIVSGRGTAARQILDHPKAASFDKSKVLVAVQSYRDQARKAAMDPAVVAATEERLREYLPAMAGDLEVLLARAQVRAGEAGKAVATLDAHARAEGMANGAYFLARADAFEALGRPKDAHEALLGAALENHRDGLRRAKESYIKQNGKEDGFEALLDGLRKELPFHPAAFKPGPAYKGKTVLAELFTGSECPPCVAADLAFDGLLESHPSSTLVILEYHLPIPAPDPMMNPASKKRQELYGVNSTPTAILEGQEKLTGGGGRSMAGQKYKQLFAKIQDRIEATPGAILKVGAVRKGDRVEAAFSFGKPIAEVDYNLALVQAQQEHKGGNKILVHKMVVKDIVTLDPVAAMAVFDLAASEKATDAYLTAFEQTSTRFKDFKFPQRRHAISREGLKIVLFAQERASKKVLQAVVADVK
jgi:thiol-disulfide isomerase/thioredoxin